MPQNTVDDRIAATYETRWPELSGPAVIEPATSSPVWPAEPDLMARLAGLTLVERWVGWTRELFTSESRSHVSVWRKPGSGEAGGS